jgi:DNA/RNA-binding domain of Phe-tRNA-synthetase-like protein
MRFADPARDRFNPLGGKAEDFPLNPDLVVYAADDIVLCWGFNCRDNVATALDAGSDDIVFFSEAVDGEGGRASARAIADVRARLSAAGVECSAAEAATRERLEFSL